MIKSFRDLEVYQNLYQVCLVVTRDILPQLPNNEKFDLISQLSRSSKAAPRLIAEGFAKKHQRAGFQKYIDDAMAECNECVVSLEQVRDIYHVGEEKCRQAIIVYDRSVRQLFRLAEAWDRFTLRTRSTTPYNHTILQTQNR